MIHLGSTHSLGSGERTLKNGRLMRRGLQKPNSVEIGTLTQIFSHSSTKYPHFDPSRQHGYPYSSALLGGAYRCKPEIEGRQERAYI